MNIDVTSIILGLIAAAVAWVVFQVRTLKITVRVDASWQWILDDAAHVAVRASDQIKGENEAKLTWATDYVVRTLAQYKLNVDSILVRGAIENAYVEFKAEVEAAGK